MSHLITGLDIGSTDVKGVVVEERKDGTLAVLAAFRHPSAGVRRGVLVDVEDATAVLRRITLDLAKISRKATQNVFVNVNGDHVHARLSRGNAAVSRADQEIQQDDIDRALQASRAVKLLPNYLVLHNIVREFFVDDVGDIMDSLGMTGNRLDVSTLIVEAFAPQVHTLVKHCGRVGLKVGGLVFNPLAAARSVLTKRQKDLGALLLDFGAGTTSLVAYEENKVAHVRSIPLGAGYLTSDIAIGLRIPADAAEALKVEHGAAVSRSVSRKETVDVGGEGGGRTEVPRRFLAEIIEVRLAEILDLVNNELKLLGRGVQLPGGVAVTGGGAKLQGIVDLVRDELRLPVQMGYPSFERFEVENPTYRKLLDDPSFTVAVGLVLCGAAEEGKAVLRGGALVNFLRNLIP